MSEKLKPCPFCGAEAEEVLGSTCWMIRCTVCRAEIRGTHREMNVKNWNRRAWSPKYEIINGTFDTDPVSRQAAIEALCDQCGYYSDEQCKTDSGFWCESGARIRNLPPVTPTERTGEWIPVSERLPEDREDVLVYLSSARIAIASYNEHKLPFRNTAIGWGYRPLNGHINWGKEDVIAWMLLPEPYKESEE